MTYLLVENSSRT